MNLFHLAIISALIPFASCGPQSTDGPRQELISGVRVLGISGSPLVPQIVKKGAEATSVELTVYVAVPLGETASVAARTLGSSPGGQVIKPENLAIQTDGFSYEDHNGFRLLTFKMTAPVPDESSFSSGQGGQATPDPTSTSTTTQATRGQVRYGIDVSAGGKIESVESAFSVASEGAEDLAWTSPEVTISAPATTSEADVDSETITLSHTSPTSETYTIGWFVSGGEIANRRTASTTWTPGDAGSYTLVGTVRGMRSKGFGIKVIDVKAN